MELNKIKQISIWGETATDLNTNFDKVSLEVEKLKAATIRLKGYYPTSQELIDANPTAMARSIAYVGTTYPFVIWRWNGSEWENTMIAGGEPSVDLNNYTTLDDVKALLASMFVPVDSEQTLRDMLKDGKYDIGKFYYSEEG